ncbi:RNA polymerase sigma factor [Nonomuraea indica]|uniref:RNA polymerase sigma factor n=1 Tax=Nonomuraea indica TaxID=1581193 RepID=UPI000C7D8CA7|nr:sigma-70 family RNA polymerase sigma factor [Nonomuraea indica]
MTQPLTGERSRAESLAELYDRHAAGLFAYCADQLGDQGAAADVLATVLTGAAASAPPRAALYAYARRELRRRDVVYAPPSADPLTDPASALVERALRELRPHQREVLVLSEVCGLDRAELAWALDVAPDTAQELLMNAARRYRRLLGAALAATRGRAPRSVADVYGALEVAPLRDVLGRLSWPSPPAALRVHFAGSRTAPAAPLFVRPRWPVPPQWPLPLNDLRDPATTTGVFPADLLTPPAPDHRAPHEAATAPMPKVRDPLAPTDTKGRPGGSGTSSWSWQEFSTGAWQPFPAPSATPGDAQAQGRPSATPGDVTAQGRPSATAGERAFRSSTGRAPVERPFYLPRPIPADVLDDEPETLELPAVTDVAAHADPGHAGRARPGSLFTPREQATPPQRAAEPVYRMPVMPAPTGPQDLSAPPGGPAARGGTAFQDLAATPDPTASRESTASRGLAPSRYFSPAPVAPSPQAAPEGKAEQDGHATGAARADERKADALDRWAGAFEAPARRSAARSATRPSARKAGERAGDRSGEQAGDRSGEQSRGRTGERSARRPGGRMPGRSAEPGRPARKGGAAGPRGRRPRRDRHHDWAWEAIGFLVCVAIAMAVFFSTPSVFGF